MISTTGHDLTNTGTADVDVFDFSGNVTSSTSIIIDTSFQEILEAYYKEMRLLFWKFWFGGGIWDDLKTYKVIERPKVVEICRRLAKPFWTGKNFKKM